MKKAMIGLKCEPELKQKLIQEANRLDISLSEYLENILTNLKSNPEGNSDYGILTAKDSSGLVFKVKKAISEGWQRVGGHTVVTVLKQKVYSGNEHKRTEYTIEYAQTMIKSE